MTGGCAIRLRLPSTCIDTDPIDVVVSFNEAINTRDLSALSALMADSHRFVDSAGSVTEGKRACVEAWSRFFESFADYRNIFDTIDEISGGRVVAKGRSLCSVEALHGPAVWTAVVEGESIVEWRVDEPTRSVSTT